MGATAIHYASVFTTLADGLVWGSTLFLADGNLNTAGTITAPGGTTYSQSLRLFGYSIGSDLPLGAVVTHVNVLLTTECSSNYASEYVVQLTDGVTYSTNVATHTLNQAKATYEHLLTPAEWGLELAGRAVNLVDYAFGVLVRFKFGFAHTFSLYEVGIQVTYEDDPPPATLRYQGEIGHYGARLADAKRHQGEW